MTKEALLAEIRSLPLEERIELLGDARHQIAADPEALPVPRWHLRELEHRVAEPDPRFVSLEELQDEIEGESSG